MGARSERDDRKRETDREEREERVLKIAIRVSFFFVLFWCFQAVEKEGER